MRSLGEPDTEEIGFDRLISAVGHSQMPLWLISSSGTALMVLSILLLVVPRFGKRIRVLVAVGQMPLTAYTAHLLIIALIVRPAPEDALEGVLISCAIMAFLILFAVAWIANLRYGPLEMLLRQLPHSSGPSTGSLHAIVTASSPGPPRAGPGRSSLPWHEHV